MKADEPSTTSGKEDEPSTSGRAEPSSSLSEHVLQAATPTEPSTSGRVEDQMSTTSWNTLPGVILRDIKYTDMLSSKDIAQCCLVCRHWNNFLGGGFSALILKDYRRRGKEIRPKYYSTTKKGPMMVPLVPEQPFFCLDYNDNKVTAHDNKKTAVRRSLQRGAVEAEIKMFRALEMLNEDILVLHDCVYASHQFQLCGVRHEYNHVREGFDYGVLYRIAGVCDFIIKGENYFVIIESILEIPPVDSRRLRRSYKKSKNCLSKARSLIRRIGVNEMFQSSDKTQIPIHSFTAFFSLSEISLVQIFGKNDRTQMISKEDFSNFNSWWDRNVSSVVSPSSDITNRKVQAVSDILLGMRCYNNTGSLRPLLESISDIDKQLKEQCKAVEYRITDTNMLLIDGPPGCGRTTILLGKISELMLSPDENQVILFKYKGNGTKSVCDPYQRAFEEADISFAPLDAAYEELSAVEIRQRISSCLQTRKLVIVNMSPEQHSVKLEKVLHLLQLSDRVSHVFVDDLQAALPRHDVMRQRSILDACLRLSENLNRYVWITCDIFQHHYSIDLSTIENYKSHFLDRILPEQRGVTTVRLKTNQRSTREIADVLTNIRNHMRDRVFFNEGIADFLLPREKPAHFIHGFKPVFRIIHEVPHDNVGGIKDILDEELNSLVSVDPVDVNMSIGILYNEYFEYVEMFNDVENDMIEVCKISEIYSAEYTAVIIVHEFADYLDDELQIPQLYFMLSRARVLCSVIIFTIEDTLEEDMLEEDMLEEDDTRLTEFLSILGDSVKIIHYDYST